MTRLLFTGQALVIDTLKISVTGQHNIPCQRAYEKDNYQETCQVIGRIENRMTIEWSFFACQLNTASLQLLIALIYHFESLQLPCLHFKLHLYCAIYIYNIMYCTLTQFLLKFTIKHRLSAFTRCYLYLLMQSYICVLLIGSLGLRV